MLPALFAKTASCVDPFIYALNHPKIRKEIFSRLCRRFLSTAETSTTGHRRAAANSFLLPSTAGGADEAVVIVATSSIAGRAGGHPAGGRMVLSRQRSIRRCFAGNSYQEQSEFSPFSTWKDDESYGIKRSSTSDEELVFQQSKSLNRSCCT